MFYWNSYKLWTIDITHQHQQIIVFSYTKKYSIILQVHKSISMASTMQRTSSSAAKNEMQHSQLQRRAPSLIIKPTSTNWNMAIPLLSPLAPSPRSSFKQSHVPPPHNKTEKPMEEVKKTPVFKKWQHPASPFCYEPTTFVPPFMKL
ncbi:hypothetical protein ISN45_Aa07g028850 [Arabidopsis thaliana x Arabidopsis arenosa]|uniref:Uncharacterized protein n=1 Tax=Arabidopsis thaliana x Arabidopsis arenosa TaxID=1240361 RepID=A0A8T1Y735_9BRAS|nr:hypothetical protein ISN45_Aa07g028850 [Arabidopsis thaliana x Arabidopsis arenosa]